MATAKTKKRKKVAKLMEAPLEIRRTLGDYPMREATEILKVCVNLDDIRAAKPCDFDNCVLAQACKRMYGSERVLFNRTTAYLVVPDNKGGRVMERYIVSPEARAVIERFDRGQGADDNMMFTLLPPTPSQTLDGRRRRPSYPSPSGTAPKSKRKRRRKPVVRDLTVRYGTGRVKTKTCTK